MKDLICKKQKNVITHPSDNTFITAFSRSQKSSHASLHNQKMQKKKKQIRDTNLLEEVNPMGRKWANIVAKKTAKANQTLSSEAVSFYNRLSSCNLAELPADFLLSVLADF